MSAGQITIELATASDAPLLSNLIELYVHDMSEVFPCETGPDGRFGYAKLPLYWSEPEKRFPFLVRAGERTVGFALVTRGSPATVDPDVFDIAEFFILRRYRRGGLGRGAATLLWDRLPGRWFVRVSEGNRDALPFWEATIRAYTRGRFEESSRAGAPHGWRDFSFDSSSVAGAP